MIIYVREDSFAVVSYCRPPKNIENGNPVWKCLSRLAAAFVMNSKKIQINYHVDSL